ncbi:MAG: TRIC cation channel family protein [Verrucomicrobia bacterium]|nr:TRIC cation channel family protein [Verrucomicrobiota bacterium]
MSLAARSLHSAFLRARKSGFDYVGVLTIALVTALGGGTLRRCVFGNHPLYWIAHALRK